MLNNRMMHNTHGTAWAGGYHYAGNNNRSIRTDRRGTMAGPGASCPLCARPDAGRMADGRERGSARGAGRSPCNPEDMTNCEKLLDQIRAVDFALAEIILYLDAYPNSSDALDAYHKLVARRKGLHAQYETSCGPLTAMGNRSTASWDWIDQPFPWEYKAN